MLFNVIKWLFLFLTISSLTYGDPWGKDGDIAICKPCIHPIPPVSQKKGFLTDFAEICIRFHQEVISPADGPRSHFKPSSSQYTLDAIRKYGFFRGWMMGCDRLMRENDDPWVYRTTTGEYNTLIKLDPIR